MLNGKCEFLYCHPHILKHETSPKTVNNLLHIEFQKNTPLTLINANTDTK
jgi:hypothetical protein